MLQKFPSQHGNVTQVRTGEFGTRFIEAQTRPTEFKAGNVFELANYEAGTTKQKNFVTDLAH